MAGGIDWFRWHHGSVTDPKFQLVARKAGVSLPDVLAVWAFLLEKASASDERGTFGEIDCEAVDCLFGLDEGQTAAILEHMGARGLTQDEQITAWEKRQPKRERDTDNSADRTRAYRERHKQQGDAQQNHVTPCDAKEHQKNARGEERREEKEIPAPTVLVGSPPVGADADAPKATVVRLADKRIACPAERLVDLFHEVCPALPRVMALNDTRRKHLASRWREVDADAKLESADDGVAIFREFFATVARSDFLSGRTNQKGGRSWQASFDWLILPTNFLKVFEGHYDNEKRRAM
jgi:hypothetical protein